MRLLVIIAVVVAVYLLLRNGRVAAAATATGASGADSTGTDSSAQAGGNDNLDTFTNAIAQAEGYYKPGSLPYRTNNPGDIGTFNGNVQSYADAGDGWDALSGYVTNHVSQHPDWDFYDWATYYLTGSTTGTPGPGQNPDAYAEQLAAAGGWDPTQTVSSALSGS